MPDEALIAAARAARENAYAPYSHVKIGAAILAEDGRIHAGANVENASYPEGLCAEAAAIAAMVAAGARRILAIAVVSEGAQPAPPCGGCRQRIAEFAAPDTPIELATISGATRRVTLGELLPLAFGAPHLRP
ncbi:MAG TPA: cytidine deaminase [Stellaceae bacterium]|nr:cytidine deaminase [Stellaceae bacterium]